MSTATAFRYPRSFPFCVADISGSISSQFEYVDNLSLADVMGFFWNLETLEFVTSGSATGPNTTNCAGLFSINPVTSNTPCVEGRAYGYWYGEVTSNTAWSSFPAFRQPVGRVCYGYSDPAVQLMSYLEGFYFAAGVFEAYAGVSFRVGLDPVNAGKYVLYYAFSFEFEDLTVEDGGPYIVFSNPSGNAGAVLASGTISVGGFTMGWEATDFGTASSHTGLGLSASSSYFTY
jgi:hypothetical protein